MSKPYRVVVRDTEGQEKIVTIDADSQQEAAEKAEFLGWQFVSMYGATASNLPLYATTTFEHPHYRVTEILSVVTAQRVFGTGPWEDLKMAVKDAAGGRSATGERLMAKMVHELRAELQHAASSVGASIVLGFNLRIDAVGEGAQRMFYGTAYGSPAKIAAKEQAESQAVE